MPVYFLVVANGGPKLRDAKEGEEAFNALVQSGTAPFKPYFAAIFKGCDLPAFAERLGRPLDPVVDKTGIQGKYWFQLEWSTGSGSGALSPSSPLLAALGDQLGLALEERTAPQDVLVIDRAVKAVTENGTRFPPATERDGSANSSLRSLAVAVR